ncbi:MAG: protein kinase [Deltaproteobacteria bacterium]|nr:protein kinase [Deltaproteobacteria bacterium]
MRACPHCGSTYVTEVEFCGIDGARLVEAQADPLIGQVIDRYRIEELLGTGAMAAVYRARHTVLERDFAIKVLFGDLASNRSIVARFRREAQALAVVRHSNIISVVDFGTTEQGLTFLTMDYVQGRTLGDIVDREGPMPWERAAKITRQIAAGLGEAHRLGLIHRDVKPANILLVQEGAEEVVKILDFGIVAIDDPVESTKLTGTGRIVGTPIYMAPEQSRPGPISSAADLYALGVILYQMLAGAPPFQGEHLAEVLIKHNTQPPPPLPPSGGLERIAYWLLAKDPLQRPLSAQALIGELDALLAQRSSNPPLGSRLLPHFATPINDLISVAPTPAAAFENITEQLEVPSAIPGPARSGEAIAPLRSGEAIAPLRSGELQVALSETLVRQPTAGSAEARAMLSPALSTASGDSDVPLVELEHTIGRPRNTRFFAIAATVIVVLMALIWLGQRGRTQKAALVGESLRQETRDEEARSGVRFAAEPANEAPGGTQVTETRTATVTLKATATLKERPDEAAPKEAAPNEAAPKEAGPDEAAPPARALPRLERKLRRTMSQRGVNDDDLAAIAGTATILKRFTAAKERDQDTEASAAATQLIEEIKALQHTPWLLRTKLRRAALKLRSKQLKPAERATFEARRRELNDHLRARLDEEQSLQLSIKINRLEEELERRINP